MAGSHDIAYAPIKVDRATVAALCANLVGIGLARFGYTPLIPALIAANWFSPSQSVYLGAANLAGYLAGALGGRLLAARTGSVVALRAAMVLTAASLVACAFRFGFAWFFLWRFVSGCTGGVLMALAAPIVLAALPAAAGYCRWGDLHRGRARHCRLGDIRALAYAVGSGRDLARSCRDCRRADSAHLDRMAGKRVRRAASSKNGPSPAQNAASALSRICSKRGRARAAHGVSG
jgi:hypothetical protein